MTGERARATRAALMHAAREVFAAVGFTDASITDVVARAGASVGSLYHHFAGKADLYLALYQDYQSRQEERAAAAVRRARGGGETDPRALFLSGARAFLHGCWEERGLALVFFAGDGPPGFELVRRRRLMDWVETNARLLRTDDEPFSEALTLILTTVTGEAGREVALQESKQDAMRYADEVLELIGRMVEKPPGRR